ncbi:PucR family transcriptional regulator [Emergencia timonensis]|uniref:PucR family transcriptional regulator n=1 Tax=Emergencia timonensis TaxID=1776384 RepID=UPI0039931911
MKITMDLIFTRLFMEQPQMRFDISALDKEKGLTGVRLLPVEKIHLKYDCLYVCDNTHPIIGDGIPEELYIVCIDPSTKSTTQNGRHIFLCSEIEVALFLNILQEIYVSFKDWHSRLERMVIENASVQEMLSASEAMIQAPMLIYDPSLKIIGATESIEIKDKIFNEVIRQGYLPNEYIKFFEQEKVFLNLNRQGAAESAPKDLRQHRDYIRIIQTKSEVLGHGVLLLLDSANRNYQIYLFQALCDLILDNLNLHNAQNAVYDYLLTDILNGALRDETAIADRIKYVGLSLHADYVLMMLRFEDSNSVPVRFIINSLAMLLPSAKVFSYEGDILALLQLHDLSKEKYRDQIDGFWSIIREELTQRRLRCSVSKSFDCITKITTAYQQCQAAYELETDQKAQLILYEDYWLSHLFETCSKIIPLENFCNPVIKQIAAKKQTGAASPLEILTAYLESGRQLTQAAETLHMHRNNVLYHITRLEKEYNLEMDDSDKRLHLQISLKIWQYLNDCK